MSALPASESSLSRDQVKAVLEAFSPADWRRARHIATAVGAGLTGWTPDDLLQEAMSALLAGSRVWPAGLHPLVVLKTAMRSIASNARRRDKASPVDETVLLDPFETSDEATPAVQGTALVTPEDETSGKQQIAAVYAAVAGDEDLELLVMAWADRLRGEDAMAELGWDEKRYDAARKRLMRRLEAVDPDRRAK